MILRNRRLILRQCWGDLIGRKQATINILQTVSMESLCIILDLNKVN